MAYKRTILKITSPMILPFVQPDICAAWHNDVVCPFAFGAFDRVAQALIRHTTRQ
jgi:hypothetical protein